MGSVNIRFSAEVDSSFRNFFSALREELSAIGDVGQRFFEQGLEVIGGTGGSSGGGESGGSGRPSADSDPQPQPNSILNSINSHVEATSQSSTEIVSGLDNILNAIQTLGSGNVGAISSIAVPALIGGIFRSLERSSASATQSIAGTSNALDDASSFLARFNTLLFGATRLFTDFVTIFPLIGTLAGAFGIVGPLITSISQNLLGLQVSLVSSVGAFRGVTSVFDRVGRRVINFRDSAGSTNPVLRLASRVIGSFGLSVVRLTRFVTASTAAIFVFNTLSSALATILATLTGAGGFTALVSSLGALGLGIPALGLALGTLSIVTLPILISQVDRLNQEAGELVQLDNTATLLGSTAERLSQFNAVLEALSGTSTDASTSISSFLRNLRSDVEDRETTSRETALAQIGITPQSLLDGDAVEATTRVITALQSVADEQERLSIASEIFGSDLSRLAPAIRQTSDEFRRVDTDIAGARRRITDSLIDQAREQTIFSTIQNTLSESLRSFNSAIPLPALRRFGQITGEIGRFFSGVFGIAISRLVNIFNNTYIIVEMLLIPAFMSLVDFIVDVLPQSAIDFGRRLSDILRDVESGERLTDSQGSSSGSQFQRFNPDSEGEDQDRRAASSPGGIFNEFFNDFPVAVNEATETMLERFTDATTQVQGLFSTLQSSISRSFNILFDRSIPSGTERARQAFRQFAQAVLQQIAQIIAQLLVAATLRAIFGGPAAPAQFEGTPQSAGERPPGPIQPTGNQQGFPFLRGGLEDEQPIGPFNPNRDRTLFEMIGDSLSDGLEQIRIPDLEDSAGSLIMPEQQPPNRVLPTPPIFDPQRQQQQSSLEVNIINNSGQSLNAPTVNLREGPEGRVIDIFLEELNSGNPALQDSIRRTVSSGQQ